MTAVANETAVGLPADLAPIAARLREIAGFELRPDQQYLLETRLAPLARRFGSASVGALLARMVACRDATLERAVAEALATHETSFFRDAKVFEQLRRHVLPELLQRCAGRRLRIWSAAASTGQEACSVAMLLVEIAGPSVCDRVEIVGTDFASTAVERARQGRYSPFEVQRGVPAPLLVRHFEKDGGDFRVRPQLARTMRFEQHNLLDPPHRLGTFDLVLLRNVLIYMAPPARRRVLANIASALRPDGWLVLGATETLTGMSDLFRPDPIGHVFYRPVSGGGARSDAREPAPEAGR
jgi:chemotaxis protein methyltransferase CheR